MIRSILSILIALILLPVFAFSQDINNKTPQTIEEINSSEAKAKVSDTLGALADAFMQGANKKYNDCLKAFGNHDFCECIKLKTPSGITFLDYAVIVTFPKEDIDKLIKEEEERVLIENTINAREFCVSGKSQ